jgi:hypothetical protein
VAFRCLERKTWNAKAGVRSHQRRRLFPNNLRNRSTQTS